MFELTKTDSISLYTWLTELQEFQLDSYFNSSILGRSYDYITAVSPLQIDEYHRTYKIESSSSVYDVDLKKVGKLIISSCNCPYAQACKHIAAVILWEMKIEF